MKASKIKFKIKYCSPNTDEPNTLFISKPMSLQDILNNEQVDFTDGGYLRLDEMEPQYTDWEIIKNDRNK